MKLFGFLKLAGAVLSGAFAYGLVKSLLEKEDEKFVAAYTPIPLTTDRVEAALMGTGDGPDAFAARNTFILTAVFPENVPALSDVFVSVREIDNVDETGDFFTLGLGRTFRERTDLTIQPSYPNPSDHTVVAIQLAFLNGSIGRRTPILITVARNLASARGRRGIVVVFVKP